MAILNNIRKPGLGGALKRPAMPHVQPTPGFPRISGGPASYAPPAATRPPTPGVTPIVPGQDLRGTQITAAASGRLTGAQGRTDTAAGGVAAINRPMQAGSLRAGLAQEFNPRDLAARGAIGPGATNRLGQTDARSAAVGRELQPRAVQAGSSVLPGQDPRLAGARSQFDQAAAGLGGPGRTSLTMQGADRAQARLATPGLAARAGIGPGGDPRLAGTRGMVDRAAMGVGNADRSGLSRGARSEAASFLQPRAVGGGAQIGTGASGRARGLTDAADAATIGAAAGDPRAFRRESVAEVRSQLGPTSIGPRGAATGRTRAAAARLDRSSDALEGPSRVELAQKNLEALDARRLPQIQDAQRKVAQQASRAGRLGKGDTELESVRPYTDYLTERGALEKELAAESAAGDIDDRFRRADTFRGLRGDEEGFARDDRDFGTGLDERSLERQRSDARSALELGDRFGGQDLDAAYRRADLFQDREGDALGREQSERGEMRGERDFFTGLDERNLERDMSSRNRALDYGEGAAEGELAQRARSLGLLSNLEDQQFDEGVSEREERRGERGYQDEFDRYNQGRQDDINRFSLGFGADQAGRELSDRFDLFGAAGDYESRVFGEGAQERDERRGERGYASDLDRFNAGREDDSRRFGAELARGDVDRDFGDQYRSREEQRGERGYADQFDRYNLENDIESQRYGAGLAEQEAGAMSDDSFRRYGMFQDQERDLYGREAGERDEMRGERGYQDSLARQAIMDRVQQRQLENDEQMDQFSRDRSLFDMGYDDDPSRAYFLGAEQLQDMSNSAIGAGADLFGARARNRAQQQPQIDPALLMQLFGGGGASYGGYGY